MFKAILTISLDELMNKMNDRTLMSELYEAGYISDYPIYIQIWVDETLFDADDMGPEARIVRFLSKEYGLNKTIVGVLV